MVLAGPTSRRGLFRWSPRDGWLVAAALGQGAATAAVLGLLPGRGAAGLVAAAVWVGLSIVWGSNTVSHNHLHNPFFRSRALNRAWSLYLSVLLLVPQSLWKQRHLWHHAGEPVAGPSGWPRVAVIEIACITFVWSAVCASSVGRFASALTGYALGMALCRLQGALEHAGEGEKGEGVSYYGRVHNFLWFNDGHHAEHHRWPGLHWSRLPERRRRIAAVESRFAPLVRWLEGCSVLVNRGHGAFLGLLERLPLLFPPVARFMLSTHGRAFGRLLAVLPTSPRRIAIVGGGLFPRTLIVLRRLLPRAEIVLIDRSAQNVERALAYLDRAGVDRSGVQIRIASFAAELGSGYDLVVCPLAFVGDRRLLGRLDSPVATHDWIFDRSGDASVVVSWLLLKRLSLRHPFVRQRSAATSVLREAA